MQSNRDIISSESILFYFHGLTVMWAPTAPTDDELREGWNEELTWEVSGRSHNPNELLAEIGTHSDLLSSLK